MAVGTEVGQPVSILDGVGNLCNPKENGDVADKGLNVLETDRIITAQDSILTESNFEVVTSGTSGVEREPVSSGSNPRGVTSLPSTCEGGGGLHAIGLLTTILEKMEVKSEEVASNGRKEYMPEYRSGGCSDRGIRRTMEDAHVCVDDLEEHLGIRGAFYGVFDGHDGKAAAFYVKEHILPFILKDGSFSISAEVAVKNAFLGLDNEFAEACKLDNSLHSGTTVLTALLQGRNLLVANAGDCRAVLCRKGQAVPMSVDHHPESCVERMRIESVRGYVSDGYVNGQVTVARAIGDWHMTGLKEQGVDGPLTAEPEIQTRVLSEDDEFMIMGCDGLWDVFTNDNAVAFARKQLQLHNNPELCSKELVLEALKRNSQDNVTVITICFKSEAPPPLVVLERRTTMRSFCIKGMLSIQNDLDTVEAVKDRRCNAGTNEGVHGQTKVQRTFSCPEHSGRWDDFTF